MARWCKCLILVFSELVWRKLQNKSWSREDKAIRLPSLKSLPIGNSFANSTFSPEWKAVGPHPPRQFIILCCIIRIHHSLIINVKVWWLSLIPPLTSPSLFWVSIDSPLTLFNYFLSEIPFASWVLGHYEPSCTALIGWHKKITTIKDENIRFPEFLDCVSSPHVLHGIHCLQVRLQLAVPTPAPLSRYPLSRYLST